MMSKSKYPVLATSSSSRPKRKSFALAKAIAKADRDEILNAIEILGEDYLFNRFFGMQA